MSKAHEQLCTRGAETRSVDVYGSRIPLGGVDIGQDRRCGADAVWECNKAKLDAGVRAGVHKWGCREGEGLGTREPAAAPCQRNPPEGGGVFCHGEASQSSLAAVRKMIVFIGQHRTLHGVEAICRLPPIAPSTHYAYVAKRDDHRSCRIDRGRALDQGPGPFVLRQPFEPPH